MKKWYVSDIRWASEGELSLPFWKLWNEKNFLPDRFWQKIWEHPYLQSKIPSREVVLNFGGTYPDVLFNNYPNAISIDNRDLNQIDCPLHHGKWPLGRLVVCDAANTPYENNSVDYSFSISAIGEMPHIFEVLREMLRVTRHRIVVTMNVSDELGFPVWRLRELSEFLGCRIPAINFSPLTSQSESLKKFHQNKLSEYKHIRVLAFTIDSLDIPKSTAVLIPHWNSGEFLENCLESIHENKNDIVQEKIYILDDKSDDGSFEKLAKKYQSSSWISFHQYDRPNRKYEADIGLLLDYGLKEVKEQFVAMIDADLMPISKYWLSFPIWLLEKYSCSFVGTDTQLSAAYLDRANRTSKFWQPETGYVPHAGLYDNDWFVCTNNFFRISTTALSKVVSENIGFTRNNPVKHRFANRLKRKAKKHLPPFLFQEKYEEKCYFVGNCDNGVAANHFVDINKMGAKFNIPLTSYVSTTKSDGVFGQNISGLVFHFALSTRALSKTRREVVDPGESFGYWVDKLSNDGFKKCIRELVSESFEFRAGGYISSISKQDYKNEFDYIGVMLAKYKESQT